MMVEKSFGIIPVHHFGDEIQVFIVKHQKGHWGFPKGHADDGESSFATAKRELKEETGLIAKDPSYSEVLEESYEYQLNTKNVVKKVQYFICFVENPSKISIDKNEIIEGKWINIHEALKILTYVEGQNLCREATQILLKGG